MITDAQSCRKGHAGVRSKPLGLEGSDRLGFSMLRLSMTVLSSYLG
jgi:hypothetical protein